MTISTYLCHVLGEPPERATRLHDCTIRRMKAFAIAIHIPVTLWAVAGFVIASKVFGLEGAPSAAIAALCGALIYLIERLVLATPKVWFMNVARVLIGVVIALLGASAVDMIIFDREIAQQLRAEGEARITANFDLAIATHRQTTETKKTDWMRVQEQANCEANGTCGSRVRSVGPVYRELASQASTLRQEYIAAEANLGELNVRKTAALAEWRSSPQAIDQAGLLSRVEALHQYAANNTAALVAWLLFFTLVLFFELIVVLAKLVFGETVDDRIELIREQISHHKAQSYLEAVTSPAAGAMALLEVSS